MNTNLDNLDLSIVDKLTEWQYHPLLMIVIDLIISLYAVLSSSDLGIINTITSTMLIMIPIMFIMFIPYMVCAWLVTMLLAILLTMGLTLRHLIQINRT